MLDTQASFAACNAQADALGALLNGGYLRLYGGTKPATSDVAVTDQPLRGELRFASPAWDAADEGLISCKALTSESAAPSEGTATWFRTFSSDGTTAVYDGTVGKDEVGAEFDLLLVDNLIPLNAIISLGAGDLTYTVPRN